MSFKIHAFYASYFLSFLHRFIIYFFTNGKPEKEINIASVYFRYVSELRLRRQLQQVTRFVPTKLLEGTNRVLFSLS